jgi:hypothetical protein
MLNATQLTMALFMVSPAAHPDPVIPLVSHTAFAPPLDAWRHDFLVGALAHRTANGT